MNISLQLMANGATLYLIGFGWFIHGYLVGMVICKDDHFLYIFIFQVEMLPLVYINEHEKTKN